MPITDVSFYRRREDVVAQMLADLVAAIPDAHVGEDGNWNIMFSIEAGQMENLFLAHQLLLEDQFVQTASYTALLRHGEQYQLAPKGGTPATGTLQFEGAGGTYIPIGAEAAYDPGGGLDPVYFTTTVDGTIPNPATPTAPTAAVGAAGGLTGLYEYVVVFRDPVTGGVTLPSAISNPASPSSQQVNLTAIPTTTGYYRDIYRRKNGTGDFRFVASLSNDTTTTYTDNISDATVAAAALAPTVDTSHRITLAAAATDPGTSGNVIIGSITVLSEAPAGLIGVTNTVNFVGGSEPEDTEDFRTRLLEWIRNPGTGSPDDLKAIAETVTGVETATVFPNDPVPGTATIRISGPGGTIPSAAVQSAVFDAITANGYATVTYVVSTFTAVPTTVTVDVTTSGTYTLADVTPSVQTAITNYINGLGVGETLYISGIIAAVKPLAGILDVTVTTPATNQTTAAASKRTAGTITVT